MIPPPDTRKPSSESAPTADPLVVREHARQQCRIDATASISADSPARLTLARTIGDGTGGFSCRIVDFSHGGVGVESPVFLPREAALELDVAPPSGLAGGERLRLKGIIRRSAMTSRTPMYYLGVAFDQPPATSIQMLQRLASLTGPTPHTTETTIARE